MSESRNNVTRRRRTANTEVSNSHKSSSSGGISAILSLAVILTTSVYLMIPNQVDEVLGRTADDQAVGTPLAGIPLDRDL